jgi:hypothetical protein
MTGEPGALPGEAIRVLIQIVALYGSAASEQNTRYGNGT